MTPRRVARLEKGCDRCHELGSTWCPSIGDMPLLVPSAGLCGSCEASYQSCRFLIYITEGGSGFVKPTGNASTWAVVRFEKKAGCTGQLDLSKPILEHNGGPETTQDNV